MHTRRTNDFITVRVEGAILPADILKRIASGDTSLGGIDEGSYHLTSGEKINEAVSQSWNKLLGNWANYKGAVAKLPADSPATKETRERWLLPLFLELGYGRLVAARKAVEVEGKTYPLSHFWSNVPIHLVGSGVSIDKAQARIPGAARTSPHGLVQEFLNRTDDYLWAFVSNGKRLRILRDNSDLVRQAFVEFDLESMMEGEVYSDFVLLWLLCHQSRVEAEKPTDFWLEKWSHIAQEQGVRALEGLRKGVEEAITSLGKGFLAHRANRGLRERLKSGELDKQDYYRQLLRLVYRLLFLIVAEDRGSLLDPNVDEEARKRYTNHYSTAKLRRLAGRRYGSRHSDLYVALRLVMDKLGSDAGCPELGLPALGSFLFSKAALPNLEGGEIANHDLLNAVRALAFTDDRGMRRQVDYKNLGSEELGSIYESLLELHPELNVDAATFSLSTTIGNERKTTGSYYTPTSLINSLLDSALEPVLDGAAKQKNPEAAILNLKVCDSACGSGHFLIAAAHRMAKRLAQVRTEDAEPSPEAVRHALRDVVGRCIYGVDINQMAVELCKVSLWMETVEPGKPLSFLDHHILCGNSLLGTTPALIKKGIPSEAFKPIDGDDPEYCREYKRRNRDEGRGQRYLPDVEHEPWRQLGNLASSLMSIEDIADDTIEGVHQRQERYEKLVNSSGYRYGGLLADAWCAAFVWKKRKSEELPYPITEDEFRRIEESPFNVPKWMGQEIKHLATQYRFFHWHLAFPGVFRVPSGDEKPENELTGCSGGFDLILSNPPWERVKLQEKEWFAGKRPDIADAPNAAARKRLIESLHVQDPTLYGHFQEAVRQAEGESHLLRNSGAYPLCGRGDINLYAVFAENMRNHINPAGHVGAVLPSGLVTDDTTKYFFNDLMERQSLVSFFEFENEGFFVGAGQGHMVRFALTTICGSVLKEPKAEFLFQGKEISEILDAARRFTLNADEITLLNPNTRTCPIFRSKRDAVITKEIYRRLPVLIKETPIEENPWGIKLSTMFHMANNSTLFRTRDQLETDGWHLNGNIFEKGSEKFLPLYEAKMIYQFTHRYGDFSDSDNGKRTHILPLVPYKRLLNPNYLVMPFYWVKEEEIDNVLGSKWGLNWLIGWRDVTDARASARTVICAAIPRSGVGHTFPLIFPQNRNAIEVIMLVACFTSFAFDYCARQKVGGLHLTYGYLNQLPILIPSTFIQPCSWSVHSMSLQEWMLPRILELVYTAWDMESFAMDCGLQGPPFVWDEDRRFVLRCELDAAFFHLYGIAHDDVDYIMETFPIIKRKDEQQYGEYRTKHVILEIYDEMAQAISGGEPYQTRLGPPPADPRVAHAPRLQPAPLVLPTGVRYPQPDEGIYAIRVILSILQANGGSIDVQRLMNACWLLAMPDILESQAVLTEGSLAHEWRQRFSDTFNPNLFLPKLDDLVQRGEIKLVRQEDSFVVTRVGSSALVADADIELDTRLALRVADSLSSVEKETIIPLATPQEIEACYRVA